VIGRFTREFLDKVEHPPTADDMHDMAFALSWDGDVEWLQRIASIMVEHHQHRPRSLSDVERDEHRQSFYWWLGIRSMTTSLVNGQEHRRTMRSQRGRGRK
jgi:hypothetical protein